MGKLEGKIALITGGSSGIGLATATRFVNDGAYTFITGRRAPELMAAVEKIGRNVTSVQGDVADLPDLDHLFAKLSARKGASIPCSRMPGARGFAPLGQITEEHYAALFNSNVKGLLFTVQKALPLLRDRASIILMRPSSPVEGEGCRRGVFIAQQKPLCARSRGPGRWTCRLAAFA
jgi:NAD(P)-dependent dehydrogenase (short-subunit alcohol dehydrogenase family)